MSPEGKAQVNQEIFETINSSSMFFFVIPEIWKNVCVYACLSLTLFDFQLKISRRFLIIKYHAFLNIRNSLVIGLKERESLANDFLVEAKKFKAEK